MKSRVSIYTDGSCHTQLCVGAWAALILNKGVKIILSGKENNTTHNRMELVAVISSINYVRKQLNEVTDLLIVSDSQYVIGLIDRQSKFKASNFKTTEGKDIRNVGLVKELLTLVNSINVHFEKIKAHQKKTDVINYNIEADKLSRKLVREEVSKMSRIF